MQNSNPNLASKTSFLIILFFISWFVLRGVEFLTGYVEFSTIRLLTSVAIPVIALASVFLLGRFSFPRLENRVALALFLLILAALGFLLFWARVSRGANMGDIHVFSDDVESTARFTGFLVNKGFGSQFRAHNNIFLLVYVPLVWVLPNNIWFLVMEFSFSVAIVVWAYTIARNITKELSHYRILLTLGLFLATYVQHAHFYDTPFAAIGVALCSIGILDKRRRLILIGFAVAVLTRETAVITLCALLFATNTRVYTALQGLKIRLITIGILWLLLSLVLAQLTGGLVAFGHYNSCVRQPVLTVDYVQCLVNQGLLSDLPQKITYMVLLLSFAPLVLFSLPAMVALVPDILLVLFSKNNNAIYDIAHHYLFPILSVILIWGFAESRKRIRDETTLLFLLSWTVATSLWVFAITFNFRLF